MAEIKTDSIKIYDENDTLIANKVENLPFEPIALSKMGYKHFMLKEIHEQPDVVRNVLVDKLHDEDTKVILDDVKTKQRAAFKNQQNTNYCLRNLFARRACGQIYS